MQPKIIPYLFGACFLFSIFLTSSCSKKDNNNNPTSGDTTRPGGGIEKGAPEKYTKKAVVEEFTGTWCGWCPRMPVLLDKLHSKYPNLIVTAFHGSDEFSITKDVLKIISDKLGVQGYPSSVLERTAFIDWYDKSDKINFRQADSTVNTFFAKPAVLGVSLNTAASNGNLTVTLKVGLGQNLSVSKAKILVYVVEDGLTGAPQANYYAEASVKDDYKDDPDLGYLTKLPTKITGYVYNHVIRKVLTDAKGDELPADYKVKGAIYTKQYTVDISKYQAAKTHIVALVFGQDDEGKIIENFNAQSVLAGQSQLFD
ncbi:Omp28-related outer membrane protein [Chitinophaga nivalis]|uniref:Omp28-related outer membrane protein n=1 Tax=Chitinophaga nivalis TaxID=2991709 RepID=A0ABT3IGX8_9BACT|nr:Omp28-related outer membrane protein [Chitinophaga nivalis]MCW3467284.1 Omp28-related outer membrane protein [Chitinophaga nivalis]MCW3483024.1 Omp28-related outer membrane protein [Chitinophaga nivalis]